MPKKPSMMIRILVGLVLLGGAIWAGFVGRSYWIILALALAFTFSYISERAGSLAAVMKLKGTGAMIAGVAITVLVQLVLVGLLYLLGFGLGAFFQTHDGALPFQRGDWILVIVLGVIGSVAGAFITYFETQLRVKDILAGFDEKTYAPAAPGPRVLVYPLNKPVIANTLFWQREYDATPRPAGVSEDELVQVEARLGVTLPDQLKAIYRVQDGGKVGPVVIFNLAETAPYDLDKQLHPFGEEGYLYASSKLLTAADAFLNFTDRGAEESSHLFTDGTDKMIVLARRDDTMLFLDYNEPEEPDEPGEPRVGYVNFTADDDWQSRVRWWHDFEAFFYELRFFDDPFEPDQ